MLFSTTDSGTWWQVYEYEKSYILAQQQSFVLTPLICSTKFKNMNFYMSYFATAIISKFHLLKS